MSRMQSVEEREFLEKQKRLNTIHRNMMLKCDGDDSGCTTGPPAPFQDWPYDSLNKVAFDVAMEAYWAASGGAVNGVDAAIRAYLMSLLRS